MIRYRLVMGMAILLVGSDSLSAQSEPIAIVDVTVIDGTGTGARPSITVVINGGEIVALDDVTRVIVPTSACIVDGRGKFLIPGLWDMHVHLAKAGAPSLGLFVANGVTSVRDMGGDFAVVEQWRSEISAGVRVGPRIAASGPNAREPGTCGAYERPRDDRAGRSVSGPSHGSP